MSRGFVKDYEDQRLDEIPATLNALIHHLTYENNGFHVYQKDSYAHSKTGKEIHVMSNGVSYFVNDENQWTALEELI
jgi:hypothetical protein